MFRGALTDAAGRNVEQVEIDFSPAVTADQVISAWTATVAQTEALRVAFSFSNGEPDGWMPVQAAASIRIEKGSPEAWATWLANDRTAPLPLDGGLPWRLVIWPDCKKLVWTFHHALLDGRSLTKILGKFQGILRGEAESGNLDLTEFNHPDPEEILAAERFHRAAFRTIEASTLEFPADSGGAAAQVTRELGQDVAAALESCAGSMQVTAATLITWAWGQAVAAASGAAAVALGQVRSGPPRPRQVGFFMNTVPVVVRRVTAGPLQQELLDFRKRLLDLRAIENVSVEQLPAAIFRETRGPWPAGVLMVEKGTLHEQVGRSEVIEAFRLHEFSGEPLLASAWIHPALRLEVEVDGASCGACAAASLLDHWAAIVTALANSTSPDAAEVTALPAKMRDRITGLESSGDAQTQSHLVMAWRGAVKRHASECAVWTPDVALSYAELDAQVEHLATILQEAGVTRGQAVASLLGNRRHLALVTLALARLGGIHVPLDPALPVARQQVILDHAEPVVMLRDSPDLGAELRQPQVVWVDGAAVKSCGTELPKDPQEVLAILYTSGSTGTPKGVMMVHGGVVNEVTEIARLTDIAPGARVLQFASPGFDASLEEVLATLLSGATLVPRPEEITSDLGCFQDFIQQADITVLDLPTAFWAAWSAWMSAEKRTIPQNVRTVIIGGERASAAALHRWFAAGGRAHRLVNTYGPTEASIVGTVEIIDADWNEPGEPAIGRPLPGVFARIADPSGALLPHGAAGELWLGGICVGAGYWKRPDLTALAFQEMQGLRWYRTGDRVYRDAAGKLRFLGRQDDQLKIRGNRIEPDEVSRVLEAYPGVSAAHTGPVKGQQGELHLAAWVRWNGGAPEGWPGLLASHAASHLAGAAVPTRWAQVEQFKLTERGKLDRRELPEPTLRASLHSESGLPETLTEKRLAALWSGLLGVEIIGRDESFFALGGHSLAALQLFAGIYREWKVRIPMASLIQAPTLRMLAAVLDKVGAGGGVQDRSIVVPIRSEGHLPPLFCIHGGDGGVFFYRDLSEHLPPGRPLLAIEAPALATEGRVKSISVEQTAAAYITALRAHQPDGPFHLAGYSYGGLLVFEMARQLIQRNEVVAFLALVDTMNPATSVRTYSLWERGRVFLAARQHLTGANRLQRLLRRVCEGVITYVRVRREIRAARTAGITEPHSTLRMLQVREAHWRSMEAYKPEPLACKVTLFKSKEIDDKYDVPADYGWSGVTASLEMVEVDGEHLEIFAAANVASLAGEIDKRLEQCVMSQSTTKSSRRSRSIS